MFVHKLRGLQLARAKPSTAVCFTIYYYYFSLARTHHGLYLARLSLILNRQKCQLPSHIVVIIMIASKLLTYGRPRALILRMRGFNINQIYVILYHII